jgi:hypothetical protein
MIRLSFCQEKPWQSHGNLKKTKQRTPGLEQVVIFLQGDEKVTVIWDENGDAPCP